jgi:hypothetical protein
MDKKLIMDNWNLHWKNYARLNKDLALNHITTKRALLNHYNIYGYIEQRRITDITIKQYILNEKIFREKL